jgi:hypothetical protein
MRHSGLQFERLALNLELLEALRDSLRDLNNLRVVPANDPHIIRLKKHLRDQIAQLERETFEQDEVLAA